MRALRKKTNKHFLVTLKPCVSVEDKCMALIIVDL